MSDSRSNARGIAAMLACCLFFILNDSFVKAAGESLPLAQIVVIRGVIATALIGLLAWWTGALAGWRRHLSGLLMARTAGEVGATWLYLSALLHLPIANISTIAQAAPLMITAAGALFFGERVGWRRWTAIAVGFLGILVIVRPDAAGFNGWSIVAFGSVLLVVLRDVTTRAIPPETSAMFISAFTSLAVLVTAIPAAIGTEFVPMSAGEFAKVAASAVFLLLGYVTVVEATRYGDIGVVAPFRYAFIPYAILIGWLVWGDVPDAITFVGIAIVVGAGLYTVHRERVVRRQAAEAAR